MRYRELDEVRAAADVPEAGVRAGDRGVVALEQEGSPPAVEVEYADGDSATKAFVVYTPDLGRVLSVHPEPPSS